MCYNRLVGPCLKKVSCKYHGQALRNKKVIRVQASWSMNRNFWNDKIFEKIDAAEGFRPLNSSNSLAGAISMLCGAPTIHPT